MDWSGMQQGLAWLVSVGLAGFFGKEIYAWWQGRRRQRRVAREQLQYFRRIMDDAYSTFMQQNKHRARLHNLLKERFPDFDFSVGYEQAFFLLAEQMNAEEQTLARLIRGLTLSAGHAHNQALLKWASEHTALQLLGRHSHEQEAFDEQLAALRLHLNEWMSKYNGIFVHDERYCLVYLGGEQAHGTPFPKLLHGTLDDLIQLVGR